jgi:hypothetical protein
MNWAALIAMLLEFFGPMIRKLLEDIFQKVQPKMLGDLALAEPPSAITELFRKAKAETWVWNVRKRMALATCERIARNHSYAFWNALKGDSMPPLMSSIERAEVEAL